MSNREVTLDGGSPWGFRMHGGTDVQQPLRISRVNPGSKAAQRGIREGDFISSINGQSTREITNAQAHALLRNSGDHLILGLNQEGSGSPKRRLQKIQHENKEDPLKRNSLTSNTSSTATLTNFKQYNEIKNSNGLDLRSEVDQRELASKKIFTSYVKQGSSTSNSKGENFEDDDVCIEPLEVHMADNTSSSSRSRKSRRSRTSRNKSKKSVQQSVKTCEPSETDQTDNVVVCDREPDRVESPISRRAMVKSRSLDDDDDHVRITELPDDATTPANLPTAIISEADSDIEWETTSDLKIIPVDSEHRADHLTVVSLPLEEHHVYTPSHISPEDERSLRDFLQGLNLVCSPEESIKRLEKCAADLKTRKAKKRAAIMQHFLPYYENPRYLDIISEEGSDLSDREHKQCNYKCARVPITEPDDDDDVFETADTKEKKLRSKFQSKMTKLHDNAILVGTKIIEKVLPESERVVVSDTVQEAIITKSTSTAEVVYLEDSSSSMTPSDLIEQEGDMTIDLDADDEEDISTVTENLEPSSCKAIALESDSTTSDTVSRVSLPMDTEQVDEAGSESSRSSRSTSQCTTLYRPGSTSLDTEEEPPRVEVGTLRSLCINILLSMPFGPDVMEELAKVSLHIEELTAHTSIPFQPTHHPEPVIPHHYSTKPVVTYNTSERGSQSLLSSPNMDGEKWVGLPTKDDPKLLLCLSKSQKNLIEGIPPIPNEADTLLDLHEKYTNRRSYYEKYEPFATASSSVQTQVPTERSVPRVVIASKRIPNIQYDEYIKRVTREVPMEVERQTNKPVNNLVEPSDDRVEAHELDKLLSLARKARRVQSNLSYENRLVDIMWEEFMLSLEIQKLLQEEKEVRAEQPEMKSNDPVDVPDEAITDLEESRDERKEVEDMKIEEVVSRKDSPSEEVIQVGLTTPSEDTRARMYDEYMSKVAEREQRKSEKVLKVTMTTPSTNLVPRTKTVACAIEEEFMSRVRARKGSHPELDHTNTDLEEEDPVMVFDGTSVAEARHLPKHLLEFLGYGRDPSPEGVWTPGITGETQPDSFTTSGENRKSSPPKDVKSDEPLPVVWSPKSAGSSPTAERREFRPVSFESPILGRKTKSKESTPVQTPESSVSVLPPWENSSVDSPQDSVLTLQERRLTTSHSAPVTGLNNLSKLPRVQNPTITLLQKAREGQLPRGASYTDQSQQIIQKHRSKDDRPPLIRPNEILYSVKNEYLTESSDSEKPKKMADLGSRKFEGIGPTTKDGMPLVLRSEVKDSNTSKWYKRMYDTLHRPKNDDEYVTVKYKTRKGRYPYTSAGGYLSEPEALAYDSDVAVTANKYATMDRRRLQQNRDKENEYITYTIPRNKYGSASVKYSADIYKNQPGRIEDYIPGHSSISEKEAKEHLQQQKHVPQSKSFMSHAIKESGYESDSTLVFRRREDSSLQLSPQEQKEAYKTIQKGGEVPLHGLRKPAPERPKEPLLGPIPPPKGHHYNRDFGSESPRKYVEDEVTIHYRTPIRHEVKEILSDEELARRQAEIMRRIYQEERRRKYLQELQDMNSRRHSDNFIPSQKSPIPLNRYDDFVDDLNLKVKPQERSPEPRIVARALYNFVGQSSRELTFRKGDIIFIRRQVDKNWYEGEYNAMVGLFPSNYVEIIPYDGIKSTPRKAHEGQARAKFNFIAQTHLELSLVKGELVVLTRRVDNNWFEGRIGSRKGIFPVSYVEVLIDPTEKPDTPTSNKPVASPAAHSLLLNGSSGGKESMGSHHYQPTYQSQQSSSYHAKPVNVIGTASYSIPRAQKQATPAVNEALHIDTHSEPVPYKALYKYRPQNDDELELQEGDTVYVLEKCDDGWYVGSSQRTGGFGTFPGNYVERI